MLPPQTQRDEWEGVLGTQMERVMQKGFPEEHLGRNNESGELGIHFPDLIPSPLPPVICWSPHWPNPTGSLRARELDVVHTRGLLGQRLESTVAEGGFGGVKGR